MLFILNDGWGNAKQLACACDVGGTIAAGEQAVMTDAVEALRQHVQEEPADKLVRGERHRLPAIGSIEPIVLPAERHTTIVGGYQPPVGDGDAMRVAGEIAQYGFWAGERLLGVDDPFDLPQRGKEDAERSSVGKVCVIAEELQLAGVMA